MRIIPGLSMFTLAVCLVQAGAVAQSAQVSAGDSYGADAEIADIIVTAQKRSEKLQDVPIAISSISADRIRERGISDTRDLNMVVPSLNVTSSTGHSLPSLRGVGTAVVGPGFENPVAFYVDGVYYADTSSSLLTFNNVSQIDVLKGPQGTLFGRNATGGLIQITTADPSQTPKLKGSVSYGNYQSIVAKAYVTTGLLPKLAADLAVQYSHQGQGYGTNGASGRDANSTPRDFAARSKLLFEPAEGSKITLIGDYSDSSTSIGAALGNAPGRKPLLGPLQVARNVYNIDSDIEPNLRVKAKGVSGRIEQELGGARLVSITAYRQSSSNLLLDADGTPTQGAVIRIVDREHQFSQEVQLLSNTDNRQFQWVIGGYYYTAEGQFAPAQVRFMGPLVDPNFPLSEIDTFGKQNTQSIAGFAEAKIAFTDFTRLTLGVRMTHEKRTLDATQLGYLAGGIPLGNLILPISATMKVTKPTWRAVIDQKIGENAMVYASYNRGFKSGGFNASIPTDPSYRPEKLDAYEAGLKSTLLDRRLRFNASGYYYDYGNYQAASFVLGNIRVVNAAARIYGAEADLEAALTNRFRVNAGIGWTHARFTSFPGGTLSTPLPIGGTIGSVADLSGNKLPYVPSLTTTIGGNYSIDAFGGRLGFDANLYYNSGWHSEADNLLTQKGYELVTGSISWTDPSDTLTLRLWGKNLTNSHVATQIASSALATAITYQAPRTYGIELGFKF